jgi:hypothetical protein
MSKSTLASFILLLAIQATAGAEMYRCELADGSVIYGDKRVNLSDQCQPVTADEAKEYLSVQQGTTGRPEPEPGFAAEPATEHEAATRAQLDTWVARATTLVENYDNARTRRIRESFMVNKLKAKQEMASLNAEKKVMLAELQDSSLSQQEREKVRGILAQIPEDAP